MTPKDEEAPTPATLAPKTIPKTKKADPIPTPAPTPIPAPVATPAPASNTSTQPGPENPLGFLDPDTTGELMTKAKKKTVTSANAQLAPAPKVEGDKAIDVDPPQLPELKE